LPLIVTDPEKNEFAEIFETLSSTLLKLPYIVVDLNLFEVMLITIN